MKTIFTYSVIAVLALSGSAGAKDKNKDKDRDHRDDDRVVRVEHDGDRDRDYQRDHSRTIYVIERERPVERVVFVDDGGRYYQVNDGRRSYVSGRYFESYPSRYYTPEGRVRVGIRLPF